MKKHCVSREVGAEFLNIFRWT